MLPTEVKVGHVFRYSYLWHWQHHEGREEAEKDRPCLVLALVTMQEDGSPVVRVLPITHTPPSEPTDAIEIPAAVKLRLRLDSERSWIVLTESNRFAWPGPDIRPLETESGYYGPLPPALFAAVKRRFVAIARSQAHRSTPRSA
ncbi:plasmid maintenance toxin (PemK-like) [Mesorhizobium sp. B2-6-5]|uniref:plasmid maintenance toxin (PemK-like) n=1 Tax=Mesorhizobium sp. B2-6-5 TaxID=2589912 RepID=UPI00112B36AA|nr:plasmid maintenance toxin (PemK-like) [Mesorhizobium sp. B2-6-5]TPJ38535.1 plasmid maintenance toxin (PemK-like) [Mesorhizobium sp. B2-6-5]